MFSELEPDTLIKRWRTREKKGSANCWIFFITLLLRLLSFHKNKSFLCKSHLNQQRDSLQDTASSVHTGFDFFFLHFKILCHVQQTAAFNMFFVISVFWFCSSSCNLHNKGDILFILFTTKIEGNFVIRMHLTVRCLGFVARFLCERCSFSFKVKIGRITK